MQAHEGYTFRHLILKLLTNTEARQLGHHHLDPVSAPPVSCSEEGRTNKLRNECVTAATIHSNAISLILLRLTVEWCESPLDALSDAPLEQLPEFGKIATWHETFAGVIHPRCPRWCETKRLAVDFGSDVNLAQQHEQLPRRKLPLQGPFEAPIAAGTINTREPKFLHELVCRERNSRLSSMCFQQRFASA